MTITVQFDFDSGQHVLYVKSKGMSAMPAGPRIFRAPPHPDIQFAHEDQERANEDAAKLRAYLANLDAKGPSKKELRSAQA